MTRRKPAGSKDEQPDDIELFRQAVADAKPLAPSNRARIEGGTKPPPYRLERDHTPFAALRDDLPAPTREPGQPLQFARAGVQRQVVRELRRERRSVDAELDLHGLTVAEARALLTSFLIESGDRGLRRVRIIHGKGLRSPDGEGVLKGSVASWLTQWDDVLAFAEARHEEGGSGAVVVLLKTHR